ncbi:hypothetical protein RSSM_01512 [Rhodopirellula sallentina SM41]|uniref:Uncharacterized protein n=1 Tax=Rhodopirellula sallentina SM41 TaxID=1263870 RepID=M5UM03_9BACT|nr:hypothetical protein RSSM_01512 [Rhodopirellula sallentina SM41]
MPATQTKPRTTSVPCKTNGQHDRAQTARGLNNLLQFQRLMKQVQPPGVGRRCAQKILRKSLRSSPPTALEPCGN